MNQTLTTFTRVRAAQQLNNCDLAIDCTMSQQNRALYSLTVGVGVTATHMTAAALMTATHMTAAAHMTTAHMTAR